MNKILFLALTIAIAGMICTLNTTSTTRSGECDGINSLTPSEMFLKRLIKSV
jgi:hypothetical protein